MVKGPDDAQIRAIKRIICIPQEYDLPKCRGKSATRIRKFEAAGDTSHSGKKHICAVCQCSRIAGAGTWGDFYGLGENTGHYGVGFCSDHEKGSRKSKSMEYARNHMRDLQTQGKAPDNYLQVVNLDAGVAVRNKEIRDGIELIYSTLHEFQNRVANPKEKLTELARGSKVSISDKSRMELACTVAKTLSGLKLDEFKLSSSDYVAVDELKARIPLMINLAYRFIMNDEDRKDYISEFKDIWQSVKMGAK